MSVDPPLPPPAPAAAAGALPPASALRMKVWIEGEGGEVLLSEWRVALLEAVAATGSMARAARAVDVPYRTAWARVRETEAALGVTLVETVSGGNAGGGSRLTAEGRELVARFRRVTEGLAETARERFDTHLRDRLGDLPTGVAQIEDSAATPPTDLDRPRE